MNMIELLNKVIEEAKLTGDNNTFIIINALMGAKYSGHDGFLAARVQDIIRKEILPNIQDKGISLN